MAIIEIKQAVAQPSDTQLEFTKLINIPTTNVNLSALYITWRDDAVSHNQQRHQSNN